MKCTCIASASIVAYGVCALKTENIFAMIDIFIKDWTRQNTTQKNIILTKDYLDYLVKEFNFQVTSISSVFFYKKCAVFNQIFQNLINERSNLNATFLHKQLLKKIINFSTGVFGYNQNKTGKCSYKIVSKLTRKYNITKHSFMCIGELENQDYYIKSCFKPNSINLKSCQSPLPLYCFIVEYGKMKMTQILTFFDHFLIPENYRHLYTNTDNIIFALSTKTIEESVKPHLKDWFEIEKTFIFSETEPGHLKQEFYFGKESEWKFVSPLMQNYSILTKDSTSLHKSSIFAHVSTLESYNYSLKLLENGSITISEPRRLNKILNTDMYSQTFVINLKNQ